ncbi:hypothetical protein BASA81_000887 [Batrachochytrium salamandrivorans]|nr:hypothetical protein BASA81_000887 [Batrachochytrium salamandrivorans]
MKKQPATASSNPASSTSSPPDAKPRSKQNWAQKRASHLILAPQPRLTEFKPVLKRPTKSDLPGEDEETLEEREMRLFREKLANQNRQLNEISSDSLGDLVPFVIQKHLVESKQEVSKTPFQSTVHASCLFLDVSRFTAFSEMVAIEHGNRGAEVLAKSVNKLFTQLVRLVQRAGGDIFKFAGDAVIVLWPCSEEDGETLEVVAHRAVQCACDVQATVYEMKLDDDVGGKGSKAGENSLAFKCGVGVGTVSIVHLGGVNFEDKTLGGKKPLSSVAGRREYIALGDPLKQAFAAEHRALRHDIVVSRQTWSLINHSYTAKTPKSGKPLTDGFVLIEPSTKTTIRKRGNKPPAEHPNKDWMLTYVPRSAHLFLEVESHTRKDWVSELRQVTVLFINLGVPKDKLDLMFREHAGISLLHEYFVHIQTVAMDYEGSVNKFLMDDKGSTVIAVFGLPPISHENDATRGVLAALAITAKLQEVGANPSVGVATGVAFCGVVGHPGGRREYTVLGDIVNLSARLMQRAGEKQEGVLCDRETFYQAQEHLEFNYLKQIQVKGKSKKVDIWQPHKMGYKTKRTMLGKVLGVRKYRRRRSVDSDLRDQVSQFNQRGDFYMSREEIDDTLRRMRDAKQVRNGGTKQPPVLDVNRPKSAASTNAVTSRSGKFLPSAAHLDYDDEDVEDGNSDQFEAALLVMEDMYESCTGEKINPVVLEGSIGLGKSRLLSRLSTMLRDAAQDQQRNKLWVLEASCNPFERGALSRPFGLFITLISTAIFYAHEESNKKQAQIDQQSALEDVPVRFRQSILLDWLSNSSIPDLDLSTKYLLNDDFGVDFEEPKAYTTSTEEEVESERNKLLIRQKAELICALFGGMCASKRLVVLVDDALHLDFSSWAVALHLGAHGQLFGLGLTLILASRPVADFVLIDANSRESFGEFKKLPHVLKLQCPALPPKMARKVALDIFKVKYFGSEIDIALEKAQGNPLFIRELAQSMMDTPGVLDFDTRYQAVTFGKAARMKLHNKLLFPACEMCGDRFGRSKTKYHCNMCGRVLCTRCCPSSNKRTVVGYKEPVRCCLECGQDQVRVRRVTNEAIEAMNLPTPVAIVSVEGTWIDKLSTKQQMVLKVACLLRQELRFERSKVFDAYPFLEKPVSSDDSKRDVSERSKQAFDVEFDTLVQLGFVRSCTLEEDGPKGISNANDDEYEFCHNFLPDVLNQRVLESQREELQNHVREARLRREEQERVEFKNQKGLAFAQLVLKEGYVDVLKSTTSAGMSPWKTRWMKIIGHRMVFYYDRNSKDSTASCDLMGAKVTAERGEKNGRKRVIRISVTTWENHRTSVSSAREFFITPELGTDTERDSWLYNLNMAIESTVVDQRSKRGTSVTGWLYRPKAAAAGLVGGKSVPLATAPENAPVATNSSTPKMMDARKSGGFFSSLSSSKKKSSTLE